MMKSVGDSGRWVAVLGYGLILLAGAASRAPAQVRWRTGTAERSIQTRGQMAETLDRASSRDAGRHLVVQFDEPITPALRARLKSAGVTLTAYLGDQAFFASVAPGGVDRATVEDVGTLVDAREILPSWKLHPVLDRHETPDWAVVPVPAEALGSLGVNGATWIAAYILFHTDVADVEAFAAIDRHDVVVRRRLRTVNGMVIELPLGRVDALAAEDAVQYIEPALPLMDDLNDSIRAITEADIVQAAPYNLDGSGVGVLVYDGGTGRSTHLDFQGRLSVRDASGMANHATHVAATIGGAGAANAAYKGIAPGVTIESYGFETGGPLGPGFLYTDPGDIEVDYGEAINVYGVALANNSIGTNTAYNGFPCEWEGDYGVTSTVIDSIVRGALGEPFRIVWANGNERGSGRCGTTYHTTAPPACAKNHITVGALNSNDDSVSYFTSWGPTDDGRLKPDISAPGCQIGGDGGVTSAFSTSDTAYGIFCGTSMASPTVCGLSALILEDYRAQFPQAADFRNSTLKALLAHNAEDIENPGPDYMTGYGSVRVQRTIDFMRTGNFLEESVDQDQVYTVLVLVDPTDTELKVTLAWDDPPGTPNVNPALVNDLDLLVFDPNGIQHFPWTLGGLADPAAPAVRTQLDHVNNIEQVFVENPSPGAWIVEVHGFNVPEGPQPLSLCLSPRAVGDCNENGINDLEDIAEGTSEDCNANTVPDECEPIDDCNGNGAADICDLADGTSQDINENYVPDECDPDCNGNDIPDDYDIDIGTSPDCNENAVPDECDLSGGTSVDCNANGIPDECEDDCNRNGVADECDVDGGGSVDCNVNGVPDECETDCNSNGVADECDIADGTSEDLNGNGFPDECSRLFVNEAAAGSGDGSDWPDAYRRLRNALSHAANNSDITELWVAAGTYTPAPAGGDREATFALRGGVGLYGGFAGDETHRSQRDPTANETVLDADLNGDDEPGFAGAGENSHHVVTAQGVDGTAILDGFTVRGGYITSSYGGGGVLCLNASPTIANCRFVSNLSGFTSGGAIYILDGDPTISNCSFQSNYVHLGQGGAIYIGGDSQPIITDCDFLNNTSVGTIGPEGAGGAIANRSNATVLIRGCTFSSNIARNFWPAGDSSGGYAGAVYHFGGELIIENCAFTSNWSNAGGAIFAWDNLTVTNSLFRNNSAPSYDSSFGWGGQGGAIGSTSFGGATILISGCTIVSNSAEDGGGVWAGGVAATTVENSILWNNSDNRGMIGKSQSSGASIRYSCIMNMLVGEPGEDPPDPAGFPGSFDLDPQFVDFVGGDLHVLPTSPTIDAGDPNFALGSGRSDLDGLPRVLCGLVDMGSYETSGGEYACDFTPDPADFANFGACMSGPAATTAIADCSVYDLNTDNHVDMADYLLYLGVFADSIGLLEPPASVEGTIQYAGGATGTIHLAATSLDPDGFDFSLSIESLGPYALEISLAGDYALDAFMDVNGNGSLDAGEPAAVYAANPVTITASGQVLTGVDLDLADTHAIGGRIAFENGSPAYNVTVNLAGPIVHSVSTATDGTYGFLGLPNGTYTVAPSSVTRYFYPYDASIDVAGADVAGVDFESHTLPTGEVDGELSGTVTAVDLANYSVTLDDGGGTLTLFVYVDTTYSGAANALADVQVGYSIQAHYYTSANLAVEVDVEP